MKPPTYGPYASTSRPWIVHLATVAIGLAGLALTGGLMAVGGFYVMPTALSGALMSALLARSCLRGAHSVITVRGTDSVRCLGRGCLYGGLNAFPSFLATTLILGDAGWVTAAPYVLISVTMTGLVIGVPLGLLYTTFYLVIVQNAGKLLRANPIEGTDLMLRQAGLWLFAVSLGSFAFGLLIGVQSCGDAFSHGDRTELIVPLLLTTTPAFVIGLAFAFAGAERLRGRRAWLEGARAGREPDLAVIPRSQLERWPDEVIRPLLVESGAPSHVLVRSRPGQAGGAYRRETELVPLALVDGPQSGDGASPMAADGDPSDNGGDR